MFRIAILGKEYGDVIPPAPLPRTLKIVNLDESVIRTIEFNSSDDWITAVNEAVTGQTIQFSEGEFIFDKQVATTGYTGWASYHRPLFAFNKHIHVRGDLGKTTVVVRSDLVNLENNKAIPNNGLFSTISTGGTSRVSKIQDIIFDYRMASKPTAYGNAIFV